MQFQKYLGVKISESFPSALFFVCCTRNVLRSAFIPRNLPCSEKSLIARLSNEFYVCLHTDSNDFAQASADGVINATSVLTNSS